MLHGTYDCVFSSLLSQGPRVPHSCRFHAGVRRDVVKDVASVQNFHKQASEATGMTSRFAFVLSFCSHPKCS